MRRADVADELFLPLDNSRWNRSRLRLVPGERGAARTRITGVRFLAADPAREDLEPERAVQNDFHRLLSSLIKLRDEPSGHGLALSGETFRTSPRGDVRRLRFGLRRPRPDAAKNDERRDARRCYRAARRAIRRAGFVVEHPSTGFDSRTGLAGLREWTDQLRLRRRRVWWPWLLLLPLLALIPKCEPDAAFFGAPIDTGGVLLLVDRSGSMEQHFSSLRAEAGRVLDELIEGGGSHFNVIAYDSGAESCLGSMLPLDESTAERLRAFLEGLRSGGGTNLASGMEVAAREVAQFGKPTTLIVLTDAQDGSIDQMLADGTATRGAFAGIETRTYGLTPRLYAPANAVTDANAPAPSPAPAAASQPQSQEEERLGRLAELLGGHFGARAPTQ